tara:strand:+ start:679 stop:1953 length:1275 start_codon:yes stop_codon:yes gene_type:complete
MHKSIKKLGVIGVGYVGLPLVVEFSKHREVCAYDPFEERISELIDGFDRNGETEEAALLKNKKNINFSSKDTVLYDCDIFIITVPTPVLDDNNPDLQPLISASETVSKYIKKDSIIIFESTVFPGATEEVCIPIIEKQSGLKYKNDFHCGYSPERINPGDRVRTLVNTQKIISGSSPNTLNEIDELYSSIIDAGTFKATSIKVAEAAKLIENIQRDANIAIVNEYSSFLEHLDISSNDVFEAASTKWNFLPFKPGLVGGHCISVDPYYYIYKARNIPMEPKLINAARAVNNEMPEVICRWMLKKFDENKCDIEKIKVLIIGFSFKENTSDIRNTKINDIFNILKKKNIDVDVMDPLCSKIQVKKSYGINLIEPDTGTYDAVLLAVPHDKIIKNGIEKIVSLCSSNRIIFDLKSALPENDFVYRL